MQFRRSRTTCLAAAMLLALPASLAAQWGLWPADSLLSEGKLAQAESVYYAVAREHPRDPAARAALGRFLAARGGARAGAVLLEEARRFGGDSAAIARALVPVYVKLNDYGKLDSLRPVVLSSAERARARWLTTRQPSVSLRDSVVLLTYRPLGDGRGLGTVLLRIGQNELPAIVDPRVSGLVLPASMRRDLRTFGRQGRATLAVVDQARIGGLTFTNVPATIGGDGDDQLRVGFDLLAPHQPSFNPLDGLITLRRVSRRAPGPRGQRLAALYDENGLRVLVGSRWLSSAASTVAIMLASRPWTWDSRRGDIVLP